VILGKGIAILAKGDPTEEGLGIAPVHALFNTVNSW